jgi:glycine betaine/choline ABC-type transport system substrate-binding protein
LASCGTGGSRVTVGSKNFTEQVLLGEIVAQHLEQRLHIEVNRILNLGGTLLAHQALVTGAIDVYPEYTGTALTAILKKPADKDPAVAWETVAREYRAKFKIQWMPPLGFDNSFAMAVRQEQPFQTLSEAARRPAPWKVGVGYEFVKRPDGLAGLISTYQLRIDGPPKEMDLGLLYPAIEQGQVEMAAVNTTDGLIEAMHLRVLTDDKHYFPPYQAALLTRRADLEGPLKELSGKLDTATMRRLNYEIDGRHHSPADVAREFLASLSK